MNADLNTSLALGSIFELSKSINQSYNQNININKSQNNLLELLSTLGIDIKSENIKPKQEIDTKKIEKLIKDRNEFRKNKNYTKADEIRDELDSMGITIYDSEDETKWRSSITEAWDTLRAARAQAFGEAGAGDMATLPTAMRERILHLEETARLLEARFLEKRRAEALFAACRRHGEALNSAHPVQANTRELHAALVEADGINHQMTAEPSRCGNPGGPPFPD